MINCSLDESCHNFLLSADNIYNSLDPDQDRQNVCPDLDPNRLTI